MVSPPSPTEAVYSFRLLEALRQGDRKTLAPMLAKAEQTTKGTPVKELTSPLHIAVRCAERSTIAYCLEHKKLDVNAVETQHGNTPLHIAMSLGRGDVVQLLLEHPGIDDTKRNKDGREPLEMAKTPEVAQLVQGEYPMPSASHPRSFPADLRPRPLTSPVSRAKLNADFMDTLVAWEGKASGAEARLYALLESPRVGAIDLNVQSKSGTTLLHEAVARKDTKMIEAAVRRGADVYARNRKGKSALDSSKDEKIKALLRQFSNADAAIAAQTLPGLPPTFRGYLAKWTNLAGGYKTRWFVLQDGILSYYHTQEEEGKSSRGSVNLRFAKVRADSNDKHRFEIISEATAKGSSKLYLRGSHPVERARWVQVLQQTQQHFNLERTASRSDSIAPTVSGGGGGGVGYTATTNSSVTNVSNVPSRVGTPAIGRTSTSTNNALLGATGVVPMATPGASSFMSPADGNAAATMRTPSLISHGSYRSDREDSDGQAESEPLFDAAGKPRLPHADTFPLFANTLKLKVELAHELANSLPVNAPAPSESKVALRDALGQIEDLTNQFALLVNEREEYLLRRYEQEIQVKRLWEENMKALALQHAELEKQLHDAAQDNAKKRKALREVRESFGASTSPTTAASPPILSPTARRGAAAVSTDGTIADRREGTEPMALGALGAVGAGGMASVLAGLPGLSSSSRAEMTPGRESAEEGEDDFFDAVESGDLPGLKVETPIAHSADEKNWPATFDKNMLDERDFEATLEPYRHLRNKLPLGKDDRPSVSLWAILKNNIGKDLTKISFPVSFNEPTSMLQRMAEDMEFSECLDAAATQQDSTKRIAFVAAFAMSNYSSTIGRVAKPFNPMLGETFEYIRPDKHYRYVSEQVSHHPPVSACVAQSPLWDYLGCVDAKSKFLGRTFEIRPTGVAHVKLKLPKSSVPASVNKQPPSAGPAYVQDLVEEHYTWNKVTTSVSGFIVGSPTIDHVGDLTVVNHVTGDKCTLTFKPRGWRGGNAREISGQVTNAAGDVVWEIAGRWDSQLVARKSGAGRGVLDPDQTYQGDFTADAQPSTAEYLLLWRNSEKPPNMPFNLTPFAVTLNDMPPTLGKWLPPTDCRVRPDLVSFEEGRFDEANTLKQNLEDYQRQTRKKREAGELPPHEPRWFTRTVDGDTGETLWQPKTVEAPSKARVDASEGKAVVSKAAEAQTLPTPEYWTTREKVSKTGDQEAWGCEHIYGSFESQRVKQR